MKLHSATLKVPHNLSHFIGNHLREFLKSLDLHEEIPQRKRKYLSIAVILMILFLVPLMAFSFWNVQQDDSYIFYSYAKNIAEGHGYVFNPGERINATTSPLYTCLLAVIFILFRSLPFVTLPLIGHFITAASLVGISILLLKIFKKEPLTLIPFFLPIIFLSNPLLADAVGMEALLAMMFLVLSLYYYNQNKLTAAYFVCSLAVLARPDMFLFLFSLIIYDFIINHRFPSLKIIIVFSVPILIWFAFSLIYFGNILPTTLAVKVSQTSSGNWGTGLVFLKGLVDTSIWNFSITERPDIIGILFGIVILLLMYKHWPALKNPVLHIILIWNVVYLIVYGLILNPPDYRWYYTPFALGIAVLITMTAQAFYNFVYNNYLRTFNFKWNIFIFVLFIGFILTVAIVPVRLLSKHENAKYENYKLTAEWLNANVKTGSSIGADEIGVLRFFYKKGSVIDGLGLVTPGISDHVKNRDYGWYIKKYQPDYLMFNYPHRKDLENMADEEWFQKKYSLKTIIDTHRHAVGLYKKIE